MEEAKAMIQVYWQALQQARECLGDPAFAEPVRAAERTKKSPKRRKTT
jgi:hypothetical protein